MLRQLYTATVMLIAFTLLTGVVYPLFVTFAAQRLFPKQAEGSLIRVGDRIVGSELIGQQFTLPKYFWGRLSATGPVPYNASASSGSNFGPLHPALKAAAEARLAALKSEDTELQDAPVDLVTASASGLDPHISPAAAEFQVARVAAIRKMSEEDVRALVREHTEARQFGLLGEPRVSVLPLNLALDQLQIQK